MRAHDAGTVVVVVHGDADLHVAAQLEDALARAAATPATRVVVDLDQATLFDSSAMHALLTARSADGAETRFSIVCANPSILQVLGIAGIPTLVPVHATIARATDGPPPAAA